MIGYVVTWRTIGKPAKGIIQKYIGQDYYWVVVDTKKNTGVKIHAASFQRIQKEA